MSAPNDPVPAIAALPPGYFWMREDQIPDTTEGCHRAFNELNNAVIPGIREWMNRKRAMN